MEKNYKQIEETPLYRFFHLNTSLDNYEAYLLAEDISYMKEDTNFYFKANTPIHTEAERLIQLPEASETLDVYISDVIKNRVSHRKFVPQILSQNTLSDILFYSFGAKNNHSYDFMQSYAYPTAGGFNSLRIYLILNNIEGIKQGVYQYIPNQNALYNQNVAFSYDDYSFITGSSDLALNSSFSVHIVGDMNYIGRKYGDRAYRFMNLEAGHAMQNLYLILTALELGIVASGGFYDYNFLEKIGLLEDDFYLLYESFVGKYNTNLNL